MRFRLFGGLDCPDAVLAQLSILANSDVLTPKAVGALTEHVVSQLLVNFSLRALSIKSHGTTADTSATTTTSSSDATGNKKAATTTGTRSASERQQLMMDRQKALQVLFTEVCAPYLAVLSGEEEPSTEPTLASLEGFATKLVSHNLEARKLRALQAEAAAKKFVVAAGSSSAAGASAVEESGEYDPAQALTSPAYAERALSMVVDGLSQVLVCLGTLIESASRFLLTNEAFLTELTMLGVNPQTAEAVVEAMTNAVSAVDLAELGVVAVAGSNKKGSADGGVEGEEAAFSAAIDIAGADGVGVGVRTLYVLLSQASLSHNQVSHIRVEPIVRESLQQAVEAALTSLKEDTEGNLRVRRALAAREVLESQLAGTAEEEGGGHRRLSHRLHWVSNAASNPIGMKNQFIEYPSRAVGGTPTSIDLTHQQATSLLAELMLARELMVPSGPSV